MVRAEQEGRTVCLRQCFLIPPKAARSDARCGGGGRRGGGGGSHKSHEAFAGHQSSAPKLDWAGRSAVRCDSIRCDAIELRFDAGRALGSIDLRGLLQVLPRLRNATRGNG